MRILTQFVWSFAVALLSVVIMIYSMATAAVDHYDSQGHHTGHKEKTDPLAPLVLPKRDYWVGTITIENTRNIKHRREGIPSPTEISDFGDGINVGDAHFTEHDEFHLLNTTTTTIEPCPACSQYIKMSTKVHYTVNSTDNSKSTHPRNCIDISKSYRPYAKSIRTIEHNNKRSQSADGDQVLAFFVCSSKDNSGNDTAWHIKISVLNNGLKCKGMIDDSSMDKPGCAHMKPEPKNPGPQPDSCKWPEFSDIVFSTDNTNIAEDHLQGKKFLKQIDRPDPEDDKYKSSLHKVEGTVKEDLTVTYDLRRIREY
jgi:hypothetical protein